MIKRALFVLFYSLMSVMLYGQGLAISAEKMNVAYIGVDNPMTITVEGCKCSQLIVSCENGAIEKTGDCEYNFKPIKAGVQNIRVQVKTSDDVKDLGSTIYRVKYLPDPVASLPGGGFEGGGPQKLTAVLVKLWATDFETTFVAKDFTFMVKRKDVIIHSVFNTGKFFSPEIGRIIASLHPDDVVIITNIRCIGPDNMVRRINSIVYTIP